MKNHKANENIHLHLVKKQLFDFDYFGTFNSYKRTENHSCLFGATLEDVKIKRCEAGGNSQKERETGKSRE